MNIVAQEKKTNKRYLPHTLDTRIGAVNLYRFTHDIDFVLRRYHISKASLMRWNKQFDGTRKSLMDKSHRPHSQHPNAHTAEELKWIRDYHRRMPNISICELYGKLLQEKGYHRHPGSLYRVFVRLGYRKKVESTKKKIQAHGALRYAHRIGHKMANGRKICADGLLCRERRREILPIYHDRRSHRSDQERSYNYLSFYSYEDLQVQMKRYLPRSNRIPMAVLGWKSPIQKRRELEAARFC